MRVKPLVLIAGLGAIAGCGRGGEPRADAVADSVRMADSVKAVQAADSSAAARSAAPGRANPVRENLVTVTEETPGLLAKAKLLPIDAQHLAQTKFPTGTVKSGTIGLHVTDLVYTFEIQQKDVEGTELVLVNAMDGSLINTVHKPKKP